MASCFCLSPTSFALVSFSDFTLITRSCFFLWSPALLFCSCLLLPSIAFDFHTGFLLLSLNSVSCFGLILWLLPPLSGSQLLLRSLTFLFCSLFLLTLLAPVFFSNVILESFALLLFLFRFSLSHAPISCCVFSAFCRFSLSARLLFFVLFIWSLAQTSSFRFSLPSLSFVSSSILSIPPLVPVSFFGLLL